jgi:hypothetical protein
MMVTLKPMRHSLSRFSHALEPARSGHFVDAPKCVRTQTCRIVLSCAGGPQDAFSQESARALSVARRRKGRAYLVKNRPRKRNKFGVVDGVGPRHLLPCALREAETRLGSFAARRRAGQPHSLRAGFLTSAARRGASVFKMRDVSRHKSMDVLQAYVRDADLFRDHAGAGLL